MKVFHRGYTIEVTREMCLGGWKMTYYTIYWRNRERVCNFSDGSDTIRTWVKILKERIDNELKEKRKDRWGGE